MGFSGSAPEIVNGRLAMLGFVAAVAAELSSGESVLRQWVSVTFYATLMISHVVGRDEVSCGSSLRSHLPLNVEYLYSHWH